MIEPKVLVRGNFIVLEFHQTEIDRVSGGSQDNGTGIVKSNQWYDFMGADGMETFIDHSDEDIVYGMVQFGSVYKSIDGGNSLTGISNPVNYSGNWVTPLEQHPTDPNTLYICKTQIYRSQNGGSSWDTLSSFNLNGVRADEFKISPSAPDTMYIAFDDSLYISTDGGVAWFNITPPVLAGYCCSSVNYIGVHPTISSRLSITLSGANEKILESSDAGNTWVNITSNLPNITAQCILYDVSSTGGMYLGMNPGIYYRDFSKR